MAEPLHLSTMHRTRDAVGARRATTRAATVHHPVTEPG
jgi:hypothetical protein